MVSFKEGLTVDFRYHPMKRHVMGLTKGLTKDGPDWELATPWALGSEPKTDTSQVEGLSQVIAPLSLSPEWAFQDYSTHLCLNVPMGKTKAQGEVGAGQGGQAQNRDQTP